MDKIDINCTGCKHENDPMYCLGCKRNKVDRFEPRELKEGECICIYCKRLIDTKVENRIFVNLEDPYKGICFDCY